MTINEEFEKYNNMLTPERVIHIKANIESCELCKQVAKAHDFCANFNEPFAAWRFIDAMKKYLDFY